MGSWMMKPLAVACLAGAIAVFGSLDCGGSTGSGGAGNFGSCSRNADCMVRPQSCCGTCGAATRDDMIAINGATWSAYRQAECANAVCLACSMPQDPNLLATCNGAQCALVDLLAEPLTACTSGSDCRIRTNECCECGGKTDREHLIAVRNSSAETFHKLFCDPVTSCAECLPTYPPEATAACDNNRCIVKYSK